MKNLGNYLIQVSFHLIHVESDLIQMHRLLQYSPNKSKLARELNLYIVNNIMATIGKSFCWATEVSSDSLNSETAGIFHLYLKNYWVEMSFIFYIYRFPILSTPNLQSPEIFKIVNILEVLELGTLFLIYEFFSPPLSQGQSLSNKKMSVRAYNLWIDFLRFRVYREPIPICTMWC